MAEHMGFIVVSSISKFYRLLLVSHHRLLHHHLHSAFFISNSLSNLQVLPVILYDADCLLLTGPLRCLIEHVLVPISAAPES